MYFQDIDVRVGNETTTSSTTVSSRNIRCEFLTNTPNKFDYAIFTCPMPGIIGKVITIQKHSDYNLRAHEVEAYGRHFLLNNNSRNNISFFTYFKIAQTHLYI